MNNSALVLQTEKGIRIEKQKEHPCKFEISLDP